MIIIGASAGGAKLLKAMLAEIPVNTRQSFCVVLHRSESCEQSYAELLKDACLLPVYEPEDKQAVVEGCVYIAGSRYHLLFENKNEFALSVEQPICYSRPSIDVLFSSAARVYRQELIAIVLSGNNADGSNGCKEVIRHGGQVWVQSPLEAEFPVMPSSAIDAIDECMVLTVEQIIKRLKKTV
ncbi:chemotaxis protein CheB [Pleionea sp. CnH1-48]|uniref:chemotaxis protein CheB n=1 Tax=Pleionea sp. CnH1-48 TaxID=2954494 RepID=UPI002096E6C6|nr:chemotaxis protein CheB [Pleionea sp. CnH1-48]MCO7224165.1 chemotaxis protein CheB [Pleionea sp. CnH1-48]